MAEKVRYTVRGRTFIVELGPPNKSKIEEYYKQELQDEQQLNGKVPLSQTQKEECMRNAVGQEKIDRAKAAYEKAREQGNLYEQEVTPQKQTPNGRMSKGEAGISQRSDTAIANQSKANRNLYDALNAEIAQRNADREKNGRIDVAISDPKEGDTLLDYLTNVAFQAGGKGDFNTQFANFFSRQDRFANGMLPRNSEFAGYTFITRPRLNLTTANIIADRNFAPIDTLAPNSVPFMLRCLLDTQFCKDEYDLAARCQLLDYFSPFNTLLCNALQSCTGFMDPIVQTETTEGGFFSEDQTFAIGYDRLAKTYDISIQFRDVQGGPVLACLDFWTRYIANLTDGTFIQYPDAIDRNRLDYTVSIYRFIVDRSKRFVTKWAKCTGCFPRTAPIGVPFNKNVGEHFVTASGEFSVPFVCNHIGYNDPIILKEFNMLVDRYAAPVMTNEIFNAKAENNFHGVPYILTDNPNGIELVFKRLDLSDQNIARSRNFVKYGQYGALPSGSGNTGRRYGDQPSPALRNPR